MEPMVFETNNYGVPWWGVVVLAALTWAVCRLLEEAWYYAADRFRDWWAGQPNRVEDAADAGGPAGRVRSAVAPFTPQVPPQARALRETTPRWVTSNTGVLHLASCRRAGVVREPWWWADSVDEARIVVDAREIPTCSVCRPLADHDEADQAKELAAVTS